MFSQTRICTEISIFGCRVGEFWLGEGRVIGAFQSVFIMAQGAIDRINFK